MSVAAPRLARWLAGVAAQHGQLTWSGEPAGHPVRVRAEAQDGTRLWVEVPFPPLARAAADPAAAGADPLALDLVAHVERERRVGVLLVRRGGYAAGVFDGPRLVSSRVGSSYVQGTTKAGGWSQQRFARRRANQARAAFVDAADAAVRVLGPELSGRGELATAEVANSPRPGLDAVVCGGDRAAVEAVLADPRLTAVRPLVTGPLLAVPDPRLRVLERTPAQFRSVLIRIDP